MVKEAAREDGGTALAGGQGPPPRLVARNIYKSYGPVRALNDVSVEFHAGEIHALVGENGAGKSTVQKVLAGEEQPDRGEILIDGAPVRISGPIDARQHGIAVVHQHFPLTQTLTVAENIFLGAPPRLGPSWLPIVDWGRLNAGARDILEPFGVAHLARRVVRELTVAERQVVAIATALNRKARIIILDEPTASLDATEIETLFENMRQVRDSGTCVIFITHSMEEVLAIADWVTVLRDGRRIGTVMAGEVDASKLVRMIVGRDLAEGYPKVEVAIGEPILSARGVDVLEHNRVSLEVRSGEFVGLPAHMGSGVGDLLSGISGQRPFKQGELRFAAADLARTNMRQKIRAGLCLVPGDATTEGLIAKLTIEENILLPNLDAFSRFGIVRRKRVRALCMDLIRLLDIRPPNPNVAVENLSGGNRQKVVIAKWLAADARLLVMDDPTKGVDVGAKIEIYSVIGDFVRKGSAVLWASTDVDELLGLADRIVVIRDGEVVGTFEHAEANKVAILDLMIGSRPGGRPAPDGQPDGAPNPANH